MATASKPFPLEGEEERQKAVNALQQIIDQANHVIRHDYNRLENMRRMVWIKDLCDEGVKILIRVKEQIPQRWPNNAENARVDAIAKFYQVVKEADAVIMKDFTQLEVMRLMARVKNECDTAIGYLEAVKNKQVDGDDD